MISAKCITYGRVELLEEALYSYLNQDFKGECELVIVNDYPLQTLIFEHPHVKIFNLNQTFETIGEKDNFAVSKCNGDIIAVWDDDDIALPCHLSNIEKWFKDCDLLHWKRGGFLNYDQFSIESIGNSGIVYSKKIWEKYLHAKMNAGYDVIFTDKIHSSERVVNACPEKIGWIYRWGGTSYHMSGEGADTPERPNVILRHSEYIEQQRQNGLIPTGEIYLKPHWNINYNNL